MRAVLVLRTMKQILIIGGSSGIGNALANKLAADGNEVIATYNTHQQADEPNITFHHHDVTSREEPAFLSEKLDGLVYCPGSINLMPFARIKPDAFAQDFDLQVLGAIRILQAALPALKKSDAASVIFFSTVAVQSGFNFHAQVSVSKGAIEGLTRALSAELAPTIRVNAIAPSLTDTPLAEKILNTDQKREANAARHPLKRFGTPDDIAETAAFLLSEKALWITGQVLGVDGGMGVVRG